MAEFLRAVETLLRHEGGFAETDNSRGAVNWGWTSKTLADLGLPSSTNDVRLISRDRAIYLYRVYYWGPLQLDQIKDQKLAQLIFSMAVNKQGPGKSGPAVRLLQLAINDHHDDLDSLARVFVDGIMGPDTIKAANAIDPAVLILKYKGHLAGEYKRLAMSKPGLYGDDLKGWLSRLEELSA